MLCLSLLLIKSLLINSLILEEQPSILARPLVQVSISFWTKTQLYFKKYRSTFFLDVVLAIPLSLPKLSILSSPAWKVGSYSTASFSRLVRFYWSELYTNLYNCPKTLWTKWGRVTHLIGASGREVKGIHRPVQRRISSMLQLVFVRREVSSCRAYVQPCKTEVTFQLSSLMNSIYTSKSCLFRWGHTKYHKNFATSMQIICIFYKFFDEKGL